MLTAAAGLTVLALAVGLAVEGPPQRPAPPAPATPGPANHSLPFDLPSPAALRSSDKLVLAHYFPPLPLSLDNREPEQDYYTRQYLDPEGEDGKHRAYGGHVRDRPLGRPPVEDADWRLQDMRTEVRQAVAGGLDGFTVNVIQLAGGSVPRLWDNVVLLMQAAQDVDPGFRVVLMPDMSGGLVEEDPEAVATGMARLGRSPSALRLPDGRLVVAPFKAEAHSVKWWKAFLKQMEDEHDEQVALLPTFVADERRHAPAFAEISYGMSTWGARNPEHNDPDATGPGSPRARARQVKALGQAWMQPVSVQDARPNQAVYDEAENTTNLRSTWALARRTDAELVQIVTWNDYTEGTAIAPSVKHGWTFLDVSAYYATWFKTGKPPRVVRDAVYLTHRTQRVDADPVHPQSERMRLRGGSPARDTVEALTFLTEPATVVVHVGDQQHRCAVEAGVDTCTVPLSEGVVRAQVVRGDETVAAVTSPHRVTGRPYVEDLEYVGVSSLRHRPTATIGRRSARRRPGRGPSPERRTADVDNVTRSVGGRSLSAG